MNIVIWCCSSILWRKKSQPNLCWQFKNTNRNTNSWWTADIWKVRASVLSEHHGLSLPAIFWMGFIDFRRPLEKDSFNWRLFIILMAFGLCINFMMASWNLSFISTVFLAASIGLLQPLFPVVQMHPVNLFVYLFVCLFLILQYEKIDIVNYLACRRMICKCGEIKWLCCERLCLC